MLRYDGTTGAFLSTLVAPDSGGLRCPLSMSFTETDPTTLNYDGATAGAAAFAAQSQSAAATPAMSTPTRSISRGGPLPASSPSGGDRFGLASLPGLMWTTPPPAGATTPVPLSAPVPLLVPSLIGDLPPNADAAGSGVPARKSRSAADRILAGLDIGQLFDLSAIAPTLTLRD